MREQLGDQRGLRAAEQTPEDAKGLPAFTKGTIRMDREDMGKALDLFYESLGWDTSTGAPTLATYKRLGLAQVGQALKDKKLVPGGES